MAVLEPKTAAELDEEAGPWAVGLDGDDGYHAGVRYDRGGIDGPCCGVHDQREPGD